MSPISQGRAITHCNTFRLLYKCRKLLAYGSKLPVETGFGYDWIQEFKPCAKSLLPCILTLLSSFLFLHRSHPLLPLMESLLRGLCLGNGPETAPPGGLFTWGGCVLQEDPGMERCDGTSRREYISNCHLPHF